MSDRFSFLNPTFSGIPLRNSVRRMALDQIHYYVEKLSWLAEHGESLQNNKNYPYVVAPDRIVNMLNMLEYVLGFYNNPKKEFLDNLCAALLINIEIDGKQTAPVMLVIQAILHSHSTWHQDLFHDLVAAEKVLSGKEINSYISDENFKELRQKVAALIAFQHVIRTATHPDPEVFIYKDDSLQEGFNSKCKPTRKYFEPLCNAIASAVGTLWCDGLDSQNMDENERKSAYAAMMAINLVTERRKKKDLPNLSDASWRNKLPQFEKIFEKICSTQAIQDKDCPLVILSYGRYYIRDTKTKDKISDSLKKTIETKAVDEAKIFWISLPRVPSTQMIKKIVEKSEIKLEKVDIKNIENGPLSSLINTFGYNIDPLQISPSEVILSIIKSESSNGNIWERTKCALTNYLQDHPENCRTIKSGGAVYVPVPIVHFILKLLHDFSPSNEKNQFVKLVVTKRWSLHDVEEQSSGWPNESKIIFLPTEAPKREDLLEGESEKLYGEVHWEKDAKTLSLNSIKLIVARAAAAFILNQTMAFGSDTVSVKLEPTNPNWREAIHIVMEKNGHAALDAYHDIYVGLPAGRDFDEPQPELKTWKYALGIDVGGTDVKWQLFRRDSNSITPDYNDSFPTDPSSWKTEHKRFIYENAGEFAQRVKEEIEKSLPPETIKSLNLLSVAWCGAVRQSGKTQIVAAPSSIMRFFKGFSSQIVENDPVKLHKFGLAEAFKEAFTIEGNIPIVYLTNDGAAHVNGQQILAENEEKNLALVAGTGLACGVRKGNKCLPLLAEAGKMIIDVGCRFKDSYPNGVANEHFSKKTLPALYKREIKSKFGDARSDVPAEILLPFIGVLLADMFKSTKNDWQTLAKNKMSTEVESLLSSVNEVRHLSKEWSGEFFDKTSIKVENALSTWVTDAKEQNKIKEIIRSSAQKITTKAGAGEFFLYLAYLAGARVADLVALLYDTYDIRKITLAGGPMKGAIGALVKEFAQSILKTFYLIDLESEIRKQNVGNSEEWHIVRWLNLDTNNDESTPSGFEPGAYVEPGAYGAVLLAIEG